MSMIGCEESSTSCCLLRDTGERLERGRLYLMLQCLSSINRFCLNSSDPFLYRVFFTACGLCIYHVHDRYEESSTTSCLYRGTGEREERGRLYLMLQYLSGISTFDLYSFYLFLYCVFLTAFSLCSPCP